MRAGLYLILLETALVICWSSGFIGAKLASSTPSVFLVLFWRFVLASVVLLPFVVLSPRRGASFRDIWLQVVIGAFAMFGYLAFGVKGVDLGVPLGTAALISALQPLVTAVLVGVFLNEVVRGKQWVGLALGFLGVFCAVAGSLGFAEPWAFSFPLLSMFSIVAGTILAKRIQRPADTPGLSTLAVIGVQSMTSAVLFAPLALADGTLVPELTGDFVYAVAWFILFSTIGGYGFYWLCLKNGTATRVASLIYLTPPVISIWAWLMFGEPIAGLTLVGFVFCLAGVWLAGDRRMAVGRADATG